MPKKTTKPRVKQRRGYVRTLEYDCKRSNSDGHVHVLSACPRPTLGRLKKPIPVNSIGPWTPAPKEQKDTQGQTSQHPSGPGWAHHPVWSWLCQQLNCLIWAFWVWPVWVLFPGQFFCYGLSVQYPISHVHYRELAPQVYVLVRIKPTASPIQLG